MIPAPVFENDFRCEFDVPKYTDLRQTMITRSQYKLQHRSTIQTSSTSAARETMASSIAPLVVESKDEEDANLAWFQ